MESFNNKVVLDLRKVQHGLFFYVNQWGMKRQLTDTGPTTFGIKFSPNEYAACHKDYPGETMLERARRLDILDKWTPHMRFTLASNHTVEYTGKKAITMRDAWNAYVFVKKGKK